MTYAVANLHGNYQKYSELLQLIKFNNDRDILYVLGDIVDYGSESMELIGDMSIRLNVYPMAGEHDYKAVKMLSGFEKMLKSGATPDADYVAEMTEWVKDGGFVQDVTLIKLEKTFGNSRFDCYIETKDRKIFVEVKGVTLKDGSTALFPDAPTERGVKHLYELCECVKQGYEAYVVFVIKMKGIECFSPNVRTHPEFADALKVCVENGVNVVCVDCEVTADSLKIDKAVKFEI